MTLLVCTIGRATLPAVLDGIACLDVPEHKHVETVVVDNTGGDPAIATAVAALRQRAAALDVQLIVEPRRGVGHARKRAIAAAHGELVAFIDDDCVLAEDWLRQGLAFAAEHPGAGVIGGRNDIRWQHEPSLLVLSYGESFARQNWGDEPFPVAADETRCPCGAGLVLRRHAVLETDWLTNGRLLGRHTRRPSAGEDTEVALMVRDVGWEVWYAPGLRLEHVVAVQRTSLRHLLWLHFGFGRAAIYLRLLGRGLPLDRRHRRLGVRWALAELPPVLKRFWFAQRLHDRGHRVGYAPRAAVRHQNSTSMRELLAYVWEYRRQQRADVDLPGLGSAYADVEWTRAAPGVVRHALRIAVARGRDPGWRALVVPLLRLGLGLVFGATLSRWAAACSPAMRCVFAWLRFHRPLQEDDHIYSAYTELWRAVGDLAVATSRSAHRRDLHEPEVLDGTPFRWTGPIAALRVDGPGPVILDLLDVRQIGADDVLVYRGDARLTPVAGASSATRFVFDHAGAGAGPVTVVCPPLSSEEGRDPRSLGLPVVAVHAGEVPA